MNPPYNILDIDGNYIGKHPLGFNQFIQSEEFAFDLSSSLNEGGWHNSDPILTHSRISQGVIDHIHYMVTTSGTPPDIETMSGANVWNTDTLVLVMPEASGQYVHIMPHDAFHRVATYGDSIITLGEFNIDKTAPYGHLALNNGNFATDSNVIRVVMRIFDLLSHPKDVYLYGDITGPLAETWLPQDHMDHFGYGIVISGVMLVPGNTTERKTIHALIRDQAGNVSSVLTAYITYPITRYFFHKAGTTDNSLQQSENSMSITINDMKEGTAKMQRGDEHGNLSTA